MNGNNHLFNFFQTNGMVIMYAAGEVILRAGDTPSGVYMLKRGAVKAFYYNQSGELNIHTIYRSGELFPIAWAVKNINLPSNFSALNTVEVIRIPLADFKVALSEDISISNSMTEQVTNQYVGYVYRIGNLQYSNAHERIVFQLIILAERFGHTKTDGSCVIDLPLTHTTVASAVNVARETASRSLQRLARKNIIRQSGRQIIILNIDMLQSELRGRTIDHYMLQY